MQLACFSGHIPFLSPTPSSRSKFPNQNPKNVICRTIRAHTIDRAASSPSNYNGAASSNGSVPPSPPPAAAAAAATRGVEPFRGKSGSVSFAGITYQAVEERKLESSPFADVSRGSLLWAVGPLALVASIVVPQFFLGVAAEVFLRDQIAAEIVTCLASEIIFYVGLSSFLSITDRVQRPYLDFSPKRWSLITGLRGYLSSSYFTMGFKVFAPLLVAYAAWPAIGLPALVAVAPFLFGCAAQFAFELHLQKRDSSCWPIVPILFEVYRLYQLNKGAHFIERLMFFMRDSQITPTLVEKGNAFLSVLAILQILGIICLWSLATFLLRLFPSRPVAENY